MSAKFRKFIPITFMVFAAIALPRQAAAHCDSMDGPVVTTAKLALVAGDVTPVLKWVREADERRSGMTQRRHRVNSPAGLF